jgi:hypothetical protein
MEYQIMAEIYDKVGKCMEADSSLYITEFMGRFTILQEGANRPRMWAD